MEFARAGSIRSHFSGAGLGTLRSSQIWGPQERGQRWAVKTPNSYRPGAGVKVYIQERARRAEEVLRVERLARAHNLAALALGLLAVDSLRQGLHEELPHPGLPEGLSEQYAFHWGI